MSTEAHSARTGPDGSAPGSKGLKGGALGLISSVVIGLASTAPGLQPRRQPRAASCVLSGEKAPAILLLAFVPMYLIAVAYRELNNAEPDCGTTFTWAGRAFGPWMGWMGGWGIIAADIIVMANLAQIAGQYTFLLFGADDLAESALWSTVAGVVWIVVMTYICYRGIEVSARLQYALLGIELVVLLAFAVIALFKVYSGDAPGGVDDPQPGVAVARRAGADRPRRRRADRGVPVLGVGHRGGLQRGERRSREHPGAGRGPLDAAAGGHLRARRRGHRRVRRHRDRGDRAGQRGELRRRVRRDRARRCSARAPSAASSSSC